MSIWSSLDLARAPSDGPVAFHDDLGPECLLDAYRHGLYPFPTATAERRALRRRAYRADVAAGRIRVLDGAGDRDPYAVAWCSPDPRPVILVDRARAQRSLRQHLRNRVDWRTTVDACFDRVLEHCRADRDPRWMTDALCASMRRLHEAGHAHSVEVWDGDELIGGTYGVRVGRVFSADSQFTLRSGAGKVAVADLVRRFAEAGGTAVDVQQDGDHARLLGARLVPRSRYLALLRAGDAGVGALPTGPLPARRLADA
ncbi:leucyl/phenylalanyl-tRNA--protein transferase [Thermomonospora umbrina]|uniref:Leucyl/phenylalanyl-tRNA--protein transferase n=1 Tax=Thermomonospora umbrina TaxID=111806 RepID=A0A3D9SV85_9ACTN|nr:leucyl/phenylalanyl-tRNA--protein transferase [Thermomonospora umbrina]REE99879.1 leucyl/phenylalanyl-tRNA--protein transferase [Thermomonospora umbrina]